MCVLMFVWLVLFVCGVCAQDEVYVVLRELNYGQDYVLTVNRSVEYIVEFKPTSEQQLWPSRVWARAEGGDEARPVLLTARQRAGAVSWQLPYRHEERLLYEMQRTLCPDDVGDNTGGSTDCDADSEGGWRYGFSLHVSSTCVTPVAVTLRADPARDFVLPFEGDTTYTLTQAAPLVAHYRWAPGQESVRLQASAEDEACATVSVQNYTCPIPQTVDAIETSGLRMTVERSGAVQLSRAQYPSGFLVVSVVRGSDEPCRGEPAAKPDWLFAWGEQEQLHSVPATKQITFTVKATLSRAQYAVAASAMVALFLVFYVAFGALLLARRWAPLARRIGSLAVLAEPEVATATGDGQPQAVGSTLPTSGTRRRRDSTATFDSSDNSDSDSEPEPFSRVASPTGYPGPPASGPTAGPALPAPTPHDAPGTSPPGWSYELEAPAVYPYPDAFSGAIAPEPTTTDGTRGTSDTNGHVTTETEHQVEQNSGEAGAAGAGGAGGAGGTGGVGGAGGAGDARPFGLPAELRLAALARRRGRVLRARSDRYLHTLYTVAVFYALPVIQFVAAFQILMNVSGSLDICYYNFLCAHPLGLLSDFNHVLSNMGYLLLGALLMLQLRARRRRRKRAPRHEEYGIPAHYGMLGALGAGMMVVALLSASYHVCPNRLNFQFDVAFMYVLAVLSMVKIYQARHPDVNARAHSTFGVLAVLIAIVVWGVLGGGALFWGAATVLHVFSVLMLSLRIYYVGQFRLEKASLAEATRGLRGLPGGPTKARPLYAARLVMLLITNAINWAFALYGLLTQAADFASHLLNVLLANTLVYMLFYLTMKLLHGERPRWYAWCYLAGAVAAWVPALYFFMSGSSDWSATPAQSRHRNHECMVLKFYDAHDLWHLLSAAALYLSFAAMMTWDDGLSAVRRTDIAVF